MHALTNFMYTYLKVVIKVLKVSLVHSQFISADVFSLW